MARARIVCIGNPYQVADWVGPAVFHALRDGPVSPNVDIIDGGLLGLNLLPVFDGVQRLVFVDTLVPATADPMLGPTVIADPAGADGQLFFDHGGGLAYLLRAAPLVAESMPRVWVVGAAAAADRDVVQPIIAVALELAHGR